MTMALSTNLMTFSTPGKQQNEKAERQLTPFLISFRYSRSLSSHKKKGDKPPTKTTQRATGTETNQTNPPTEHQPGRTQTTQPTRRETTKAKAAAREREAKPHHATEPEKERDEERSSQEQQPRANARPTTRRKGTETRRTDERERTEKEKRTRKNPQKEKQHCF